MAVPGDRVTDRMRKDKMGAELPDQRRHERETDADQRRQGAVTEAWREYVALHQSESKEAGAAPEQLEGHPQAVASHALCGCAHMC